MSCLFRLQICFYTWNVGLVRRFWQGFCLIWQATILVIWNAVNSRIFKKYGEGGGRIDRGNKGIVLAMDSG